MTDCDDRRGILAGNAEVMTVRSDCDVPRQIIRLVRDASHCIARASSRDRPAFRGWHADCSIPRHGNPGVRAMNSVASMSINPLFLRHDLMIELGRLEMAIDDVRTTQPAANDRL